MIQHHQNQWPNKSPEPTAVGAVSSAIAVHVAGRRWLSFLRSASKSWPVDYHGDGKRSGGVRTCKFHAAFRKSDFALRGVVVPPIRVHTGRHEAHDERTVVPRFLVGFLHPPTEITAIRRIHKHALVLPRLRQPVLGGRVVLRALGGFVMAARVEREAELQIEVVEPLLRSRPCHVFRG